MSNIKISARDVVTVSEAAKLLEVTRVTIYRWIAANKIVSILFGRNRAIPRSEIDRIKKSR